MANFVIGLTVAVIIALLHFGIVDFRFRLAGGVYGLWMQNPAPPELWIARLTMIPPVIAALSIGWFGPTKLLWFVIGALVLVHVIALIVLKSHPVE